MGVGIQVLRLRRRQGASLRGAQRYPQRGSYLASDVALHTEDIGELGLVATGPEVAVVGHPDQLGGDADAALPARGFFPADAALEDIAYTQLAPHLPQGFPGIAVLIRTCARDDAKAGHAGQAAGDLLGEAIGEILLGRCPKILEREHGKHRSVPRVLRRRGRSEESAGQGIQRIRSDTTAARHRGCGVVRSAGGASS